MTLKNLLKTLTEETVPGIEFYTENGKIHVEAKWDTEIKTLKQLIVAAGKDSRAKQVIDGLKELRLKMYDKSSDEEYKDMPLDKFVEKIFKRKDEVWDIFIRCGTEKVDVFGNIVKHNQCKFRFDTKEIKRNTGIDLKNSDQKVDFGERLQGQKKDLGLESARFKTREMVKSKGKTVFDSKKEKDDFVEKLTHGKSSDN